MKWPEAKLMKFIDLYEAEECLWNSKNDTYKSNLLKKNAIENIVNKMDFKLLTVADVKDKIKSIRTLYRRELNKIVKSQKSECDVEYIYEPKLFWFKRVDTFLRTVTLSRGYSGKFECRNKTTKSKLDFEEFEEEPPDNWNTDSLIDIKDIKPQLSPDSIEVIELPAEQSIQSSKSTQFSETENNTTINENIAKNSEIRFSQAEDEMEEFHIFGQSVGVQLRKLPLHRAVFCQQKIQAFLSAERLAFLNSSSSIHQFPSTSSLYSTNPSTTFSQYGATSLDTTENILSPQYHTYSHPPHSDYLFPHTNKHAKSTQVSSSEIISESR